MGKQSNRSKIKKMCAYCGIRPGTTRDHVVPVALFPKPLPSVMVTVGSCQECNQAKGELDTYLRDYLISDIDTSRSQVAGVIRDGEFLRSMQTNRSLLAREAAPTVRIEPIRSPAGLFLGYAPTIRIDGERIRAVFEYIVRGLYFKLLRRRIPDDYKFEVSRVDRLHASDAFREAFQLQPKNYRRLGEGVFDCMFFYSMEDEFVSMWDLVFYNSILIRVETEPPQGIDHLLGKGQQNTEA